MKAKTSRSIVIIVIALVIVLLVVALKFFLPKKPSPVYAPAGELAPGFPKALIVDEKAELENSYAVRYDPNLNQYTATFISSQTMTSLFDAYKLFFQKNGWTITNQVTQYSTSRGLYAVKGDIESSVAIVPQGGSASEVIVSYVAKGVSPSETVVQGSGQLVTGEVPPAITQYFDLREVRPYGGTVETLTNGTVRSTVTFNTGHLLENYMIMKDSLSSAGFRITQDTLQGNSFALFAAKAKELAQVSSVPFYAATSSQSDIGAVTIVLLKTL